MSENDVIEGERAAFDAALRQLDDAAAAAELFLPADERAIGAPVAELRRRGRRTSGIDNFGALSLVEQDGVLRWQEGLVVSAAAGRRMRRGAPAGRIVRQFKFEKLAPNQVAEQLVRLDERLTPNQGLHRVRLAPDGRGGRRVRLETVERPAAKKRALLLVHGTFSNTENLFAGIEATDAGRAFLARVIEGPDSPYDELLAFNHPTLSVGPVMNAVDLARLFAGCPATIDVVCHSRGGLVTRWWLEGIGRAAGPGRVVAVASPLGGTSLASPGRLRASLDFLTNIGRALEAAGSVAASGAPFLTVAVGLVKVLASLTGWSASLPLIDAAVAMIPGLAAQSRTSNNLELARLQRSHDRSAPAWFTVQSNFVPDPVGWKFWRLFVDDPKARALDLGADLVFQQENDLVVDTRSMTELVRDGETVHKRIEKFYDFGDQARVHHTNYFQQEETIRFLRESLGVS